MISLYTDGSAHALPGRPGGWAFIAVRENEVVLTGSGHARHTTNNVMELQGALAALRVAQREKWSPVELVSDSQFVITIATGAYLPKRDVELARDLRAAFVEAGATARWVRGHSGDAFNEQVDALAEQARREGMPKAARERADARKSKR